jgi:DNA-binding NarL/FixJ family response regulator
MEVRVEHTAHPDASEPVRDVRLPIAVVDPVPAYCAGLVAVLAAEGFACAHVDKVDETVAHPGRTALLITVRSDEQWRTINEHGHRCPTTCVIALLVDASPSGYRDAFRAGACSAVPFDAPVETIVAVLRAALDHHALLPVDLAHALAAADTSATNGWITDAEADWLRHLKTGMTVARLAEKVGYSERSLYRLLHDLYGRMSVSNRTEAIAKAARLGLLAD